MFLTAHAGPSTVVRLNINAAIAYRHPAAA